MLIKEIQPLSGPERAKKLGLQSSCFYKKEISTVTSKAIEEIKQKDRPNLKPAEWTKNKYYKTDATQRLFECPNQIERRDIKTLSIEQFVQTYQRQSKPVIIQGCTCDWIANKHWKHEAFYNTYQNVKFKIGQDDDGSKLRIPFKHYLQYLVYNKDDSPLYLFQGSLEDKETQPIIDDYIIPPYFNDDLFKLAGEKKRPSYRWFMMGAERSGSTVHIDPLLTSAWNASIIGHKRWVIFGETIPKSIVKGKQFRNQDYEDEAINYFVEILPKIRQKYTAEELQITQFIQYPGQTVFVPGGLWHAVLNLDDTVAITQNVMTNFSFDKIWRATRTEKTKFACMFLQKLKQENSQLYNRAIKLNSEDNYEMGQKYCKQSVSMSFTPSKSSPSSSSSESSFSGKQNLILQVKDEPNMKRKNIFNSRSTRSLSKSRQKKREGAYSSQKTSKAGTKNESNLYFQ